jgi:biopolymer transport protein ExbB/TolQ
MNMMMIMMMTVMSMSMKMSMMMTMMIMISIASSVLTKGSIDEIDIVINGLGDPHNSYVELSC